MKRPSLQLVGPSLMYRVQLFLCGEVVLVWVSDGHLEFSVMTVTKDCVQQKDGDLPTLTTAALGSCHSH